MAWLTTDSDDYVWAQDFVYDLASDDYANCADPRSLDEFWNELRVAIVGEFAGATSSAIHALYEEYMKWYNESKESEEGSERD